MQRLSPAFHWARRRRRHALWRKQFHLNRPELEPLPPELADELLARFHHVREVGEWPNREREDHFLAHGVDRMIGGVGEAYDRVCSAHGIEARHPIFDRDLLEFCMAVPWRQRQAGGASKSLLRSSGILPPGHVRQRLLPNVNTEARHAMCAELAPWLKERLGGLKAGFQWLNRDYVERLRSQWLARPGTDPGTIDQVLELIAIDAWAGPRTSSTQCRDSIKM